MGEACLQTNVAAVNSAVIANAATLCAPWYAIRARSAGEATVVAALEARGFAPYCPTQKQRRRYSDRVKVVDTPIFPGYVFCQFELRQKAEILSSPGVQGIVGFANGPAAIPEEEILNCRRMVEAGATPTRSLTCGQRVRITRGSLAGVEGTLVRDSAGDRLVVSIHLLNQGTSLHVDKDAVCPVE
jgi:transcription antitermination factor NusG